MAMGAVGARRPRVRLARSDSSSAADIVVEGSRGVVVGVDLVVVARGMQRREIGMCR
jgi:hypothetical protein